MAIILGALPRQTTYDPEPVSAGGVNRPAFGGPIQSMERTGDRWAIRVTVPSAAASGCGDDLVTDLLQGKTTSIIMAVPEPKLPPRNYGTPLVNGAGQLGSTLSIDGLTAGVIIPKSKWLALTVSGKLYLYRTRAAVTANGSGQAAVPIFPMLRRMPADNAVAELASPKIEGLVEMDGGWSVRQIGSVGFSFRIEEQE